MIKKSIKDYDFTDEKFDHPKKEIIKESNIIFYEYDNIINRYTLFGTIIYCYIVHIYIDRLYKN